MPARMSSASGSSRSTSFTACNYGGSQRAEGERPQQADEREAVAHLASRDQGPQLVHRNPLDALGLVSVDRLALVDRALPDEDGELLVREAAHRMERAEVPERSGPPAGLLQRLAG